MPNIGIDFNFNTNLSVLYSARSFFWRNSMVLAQLERLKKDSKELEIYARKLEKKGNVDRMNKILKKQDFLERRIAEVQYST
jgi:hypothetical protein